jgi:hypothetical protein
MSILACHTLPALVNIRSWRGSLLRVLLMISEPCKVQQAFRIGFRREIRARDGSVAGTMPGACIFNDSWTTHSEYSVWVVRAADKSKARCRLCLKDFDVSNMGESALKSHAKGTKHIRRVNEDARLMARDFLHPPASANSSLKAAEVTVPVTSTVAGGSSSTVSITGNDTLSAEVLWSIKNLHISLFVRVVQQYW